MYDTSRVSAKHFHTEVVLACRQSCFFNLRVTVHYYALFIYSISYYTSSCPFLWSNDFSMVSASTGKKKKKNEGKVEKRKKGLKKFKVKHGD